MELNQQLVTKNLMREKQLHEMEKKLAEIEEKVRSTIPRPVQRLVSTIPQHIRIICFRILNV